MRIKSYIKKYAYILFFGIFFIMFFSPNLFYIKIKDDEASYFSHALTLGLDGDMDYTNELVDDWSKNHLMPSHPIGSGILAAPFVAIFGIIDRIIGNPIIENHYNYLGSWSLFGYVFAVNILFFTGIFFYIKSFQLLGLLSTELWFFILFIFSNTIPYFVINKYFFSHGFEFFAVALLFWCVVIIYDKVKQGKPPVRYLYLFGSVFSLNLFIRYSNINLFLLTPITFLIIYLFIDNKADCHKKRIFNYLYLLQLISLISIIPNLCFQYFKYGSFLPKPSLIYNKPGWLESYNLLQIIYILIKRVPYVFNMTFGSEMGLLYTNPIIPIGFISIILFTIKKREDGNVLCKIILSGLILLFFGFGVSIHLWWQEMASSYGYRYLLQTFPVALIGVMITFNYLKGNGVRYFQYYKRALLIFCTISVISMVFFTATQNLQLKEKINTFNVERAYSGNGYILDLPRELVKPYTWIRLASKNAIGYLLSPIILKYNDATRNTLSYSLLLAITNDTKQVNDDYGKYLSRARMLDYNEMFQLLILLFLWVIAGIAFYNYQREFNNEYRNS